MSTKDMELLRIYVSESRKHDGRPLYEAVVLAARQRGLAGATVLRGVMGFGASHRLHTTKVLELADHLPLVIEIVDEPARIEGFLRDLAPLMAEHGLVTIEKVRVLSGP